MPGSLRTCVLLSVLPVFWGIGLAQAPVGSITGTVHDSTGAVMPGVSVTIVNKDTSLTRQSETSAEGIFSAASLPAGNYTITAAAEGFHTLERSATVQAGLVTSLDLQMEIGVASEVIDIKDEAAQIDYASHTIAGVVTQDRIESLPLNGRDFLQLSMLEPGVTAAPNKVGQYNKQFDVSILGSSSANNSVRITVDGATVQDSITGGTQQNFSQEVVQEFQLSSTNFDLSTGLGAGGAINVVTRSGGNDFHGAGFFFFRDHNMAAYPYLARDPSEPASPFFARRQEGYWVGGPVKKEKLFFFSALEHLNQTAVFSAFPSDPAFMKFGTNTESPYHANELTERLDWRMSSKNNAFLRYSHDGNNSFAPPGNGDLPSDWAMNTNWADSGVFSLISVLTPALVNEFRYSYTFWSNRNMPPTAEECPAPCLGLNGPMVTIVGVNSFALGQAPTVPQTRLVRRHTFADNVNWQKGTHAIKFGGYWEYQMGTGIYAYFDPAAMELWSPSEVKAFNATVDPRYQISIPSSFNTLADLLQLPVYSFSIGVGDPAQPPLFNRGAADHDNVFHLYAEDTWKIRPRLNLNYGLGWSYETGALNHDLTKPAYLTPLLGANGLGVEHQSPRNFSPMLGFAWTVTKDNKTVVRGGAAIYYDTWDIYNRFVERVILGPRGTGRPVLPDGIFFGAIAGLNGFANLPASIRPTSLQSEPTQFRGVGLERLLPLFIAGAEQELGPAGNTDLSVRNIQLFKTGQGLIPDNFKLPYSEHASLGIQREIRSDIVVSADFVYRQYLHQLINNTDLNHFFSVSGPIIPKCQSGQSLDVNAECSSGSIAGNISGARSHYKGVLMKLNKRFSHHTIGTLAYAYTNQVGYNGLVDNSNWFASWGPQAAHQTLTGSLVVALPLGIQISGITSFTSAPPFEPNLAGLDWNGNGSVQVLGMNVLGGSVLPGGGYNQFGVNKGKDELAQLVSQYNQNYAGKALPTGNGLFPTITLPSNYSFPHSFNSQDIRATKVFRLGTDRVRLSVFGECFNVLNLANLTGYNSALNAPNFGEATQRTPNIFGTGGPRAFQLGSRLVF